MSNFGRPSSMIISLLKNTSVIVVAAAWTPCPSFTPSHPLPARTPLSKHIFLPIFLPPNILPTVARANWHQEQGSVFPLASFSPSHLCILYVCCLCVSGSLCMYVFSPRVYRGFSLYFYSISITLPVVLFCINNNMILIKFSPKQ